MEGSTSLHWCAHTASHHSIPVPYQYYPVCTTTYSCIHTYNHSHTTLVTTHSPLQNTQCPTFECGTVSYRMVCVSCTNKQKAISQTHWTHPLVYSFSAMFMVSLAVILSFLEQSFSISCMQQSGVRDLKHSTLKTLIHTAQGATGYTLANTIVSHSLSSWGDTT